MARSRRRRRGSGTKKKTNSTPKRVMLINGVEPEEARIAVVEDGRLQEIYVERLSQTQHVGSVYCGKVVNVEPSLEAAFIDIGMEKNAFLHVSDICRHARGGKRKGTKIQNLLKKGQELILQVTKVGTGGKGASVTTYLSFPSRYLVMMPYQSRSGISRRITEEAVRKKLKEIIKKLDVPKDIGLIVRTVGVDKGEESISRDWEYLKRLWTAIETRAKTAKAPEEIYQESELVIRVVRDTFTEDMEEVVVDSEDILKKVTDFVRVVAPGCEEKVRLAESAEPIFAQFGIEDEIDIAFQRKVPLPGGGSIVIDETEAFIAIDVNSGRSGRGARPEQRTRRANLEAAAEVARQLRLRDIGGVVVVDFIDMEDNDHIAEVEKTLGDALERDRARTRMGKISEFGLLEMTRQRMRPSLAKAVYETCPTCEGRAKIKSVESVCLDAMRAVRTKSDDQRVNEVRVKASPEVASYIGNEKRRALLDLEERLDRRISVVAEEGRGPSELEVEYVNGKKGS